VVGSRFFVVYTVSAFITLRWWLFLTGALAASVSTVFLLLIGSYAGGITARPAATISDVIPTRRRSDSRDGVRSLGTD
jgi:hypothetical protein